MTKKKNKLPISNLDALKNVAKLAAPAVDESRKILKNISKTLHHKARNNEYLKDLINYLMAKTPEEAGYHAEIEKELKTAIKKPVKAGLYILGISLGLFVVWGGTAPLDSAAIAEATVMVAGSNKTIQHLEGGVVTKIIVKDGDAVKIGDELIKINDTHAKAQVHITKSQLDFATAVQARLKAEQNGDALIDWAVTSLDMNSSEARDIIKTQETLFESRRLSLNGRISVLSERIIQKQEEIKGLEAQQKSANSQYLTIEEQTNSYEDLNKKGLLTKTQYYEMQRAFDDITARKAQLAAAISAAKQEIAENQIQILNQETEYQQEVGKEYKENYAHLLESMDRHDAAQDVLERTIIKAPANGIVADLQYHTVGGVISPGHKIMDIVPSDGKLIIEAKISPHDIDNVFPGLIARVQLGAYKQKLVPRIDGKVIYVSADKVTQQGPAADPRYQSYYVARIEINPEDIAAINTDIKLSPGMPATVFIVKGTRTFLQYMLSPITDSLHKAFKEK